MVSIQMIAWTFKVTMKETKGLQKDIKINKRAKMALDRSPEFLRGS